jgi:hypothetical protein
MKLYFLEKLSNINYRIAIHEGDANRRLASEVIKIILLPFSEVPFSYKKDFLKLRKLASDTIQNLSSPGLTPIRIKGINNKTASKYIKLLVDIEDSFQ